LTEVKQSRDRAASRLLLLSNSRQPGCGYLEHALGWIEAALDGARRVLFFPQAAVTSWFRSWN
jgi:peptidase E